MKQLITCIFEKKSYCLFVTSKKDDENTTFENSWKKMKCLLIYKFMEEKSQK